MINSDSRRMKLEHVEILNGMFTWFFFRKCVNEIYTAKEAHSKFDIV